jgi:hypothetical protein
MRNTLTLILLLSFHCLCYSQSKLDAFVKKYKDYQAFLPKTKLQLVINQYKLSPNDTLFIKAYYLTDSLTPVLGKHLISVDLVNKNGASSWHQVFSVKDGIGYSQIVLPDTISSGFFTLTAYTPWMRNFGSEIFFSKELEIVTQNKIIKEDPPPAVFFESGKLIEGVESRLVVFSPQSNQPVTLMDAGGNKIASSLSDSYGFASISFSPLPDIDYRVKIDGQNEIIVGKPLKDGCSVSVTSSENTLEPIKVKLAAPKNSLYHNQELFLIATAQNKVVFSSTVKLSPSDDTEISLPKENLSMGVLTISLLDQRGKVLSSRAAYCVRNPTSTATIQTEKISYSRREKITSQISLKNSGGQPVVGEFTIKVINKNKLNTKEDQSLVDEIYLSNPQYPFDRQEKNWFLSIDNYLISNPQLVDWASILSEDNKKRPSFNYNTSLQKKGVAYYKDSSTLLPDQTPIVFYLQKSQSRYQTSTSSNGQFVLNMLDFFGEEPVFSLAQVENEEVRDLYIKWEEESISFQKASKEKKLQEPDDYAEYARNRTSVHRAFNAYSKNVDTLSSKKTVKDITEADIDVDVTKYISFATMKELINEIIPSISYQQRGKKNIVRVGLPTPLKEKTDPLYFIDGVATKNTDFFLSLRPIDILSIKVVYQPRKLVALGLFGKNGIVIVKTKKGDAREPKSNPDYPLKGLSNKIEFASPKFIPGNSENKPYFKSTICWNPSVKTDSSGNATIEFFSTDDVGLMEISIFGFTTTGEPFTAFHQIEIK